MNLNFLKLLPLLFLMVACKPDQTAVASSAAEPAPTPAPVAQADPGASEEVAVASDEPTTTAGTSLAEMESTLGLKVLTEAWSGDLDGMIQRRVIRVLTVYGLGRYFIEDAREQGFAVETMKAFEATLNEGRKSYEHVYVLFIPVSRDQLLPGLLEGRGDIVVAGWTITPERQAQVDFTIPISKPLQEILVTGPSAPPINSLEDLAGKTIHVRESSSYFSSLQ
ncbi:MAG TPA: transporter substrate-binding domain-containing protein, partial [Xanthomonadales bacterium]|nr:transporter substrate-binding domain-containing protein [Xanthomonadales bacterium]